jgi:hypothetical protein
VETFNIPLGPFLQAKGMLDQACHILFPPKAYRWPEYDFNSILQNSSDKSSQMIVGKSGYTSDGTTCSFDPSK